MTVGDVLARLDGVRPNARGFVALCPAHHDRAQSLSVAPGRREGYVLLNCFRGCERGAILAALGLSDGETSTGPVAPVAHPEVGTPEWYQEAHRIAAQQEIAARARRGGWWGEATMKGADLHRWCLDRCAALHRAAESLGPDMPEAWDMLERAAAIEHEARLLEQALDRSV